MPATHRTHFSKTRLGESSRKLTELLHTAPDLRSPAALRPILHLLAERRRMDLTDLDPADQAALIAARSAELLPGVEQLTGLLASARAAGRRLTVKYGIDPTAADVHLGHTVPMILASRFQRMGHRVVFIVGDITARIGDPTGRSADRPALTEHDVRRNVATYRAQVTPFFDFDDANTEFRFNSEWLAPITLPEFLGVLGRLPLSAALQRDDFRGRLASGIGLTMAELVYSVVMALDSVHVSADIELGGLDQLLNMQMCRRVMELHDRDPELILATTLIEGTDGTGEKISKSKGNYVGLAFAPKDVFGKLMSCADTLLPGYLRALTEMLDPEINLLLEQTADRRGHPMGVKTLLAAAVTGTLHGLDVAEQCHAGFQAQFSKRRFSDTPDVPEIDGEQFGKATVAELFAQITKQVTSLGQVRRVAAGGGLRLVRETTDGGSASVTLAESDADATVKHLQAAHPQLFGRADAAADGRTFLKCGRSLIALRTEK